jgi:hypothetical protein
MRPTAEHMVRITESNYTPKEPYYMVLLFLFFYIFYFMTKSIFNPLVLSRK